MPKQTSPEIRKKGGLVMESRINKKQCRAFQIDARSIDVEKRTVEVAFASETPVERGFGYEILGLRPHEFRKERIMNGAPCLLNHEPDEQIGVVEGISVDNGVARAILRFSKAAEADEIFNDIVDGIRQKVSVGYLIHEYQDAPDVDGKPAWRITDWEPIEISIVAIPADDTVGVGRSADFGDGAQGDQEPAKTKPETQQDQPKEGAMPEENKVDINQEREAVKKQIETRNAEIIKVGQAYRQFGGETLALQYLAEGKSAGELQAALLERAVKGAPLPTPEIGLSDKEKKDFSFVRAINALANPTNRVAQEAAAFERECSEAVAKRLKKDAQGILVPFDVLGNGLGRRDLTKGTLSQGGYTIQTDLLEQSFIDLLRNKALVMGLGTQVLTGLVGDVAIPRQTGGATAYWVAESGAPTESQQAFDQVTMNPKTVGAFTDISRKLLLQSSLDVEALVRNDLATVQAIEIDRAAINGSGASNQPTGILNTAGIGAVVGGTNGLAPTWDNIVDLESAIANNNADMGALKYLTNTKVRGKLKRTQRFSGTNGDPVFEKDGTMNGYGVGVTNQVPSNLTKGTSNGVCSAIIYGNFSDLLIGMCGSLDLTVDPYSQATSGTVRVVALQDVDIAVRRAVSFAAMVDALTV